MQLTFCMRVVGIFLLKSFNKCIYLYINWSGHFKAHSTLPFLPFSHSTSLVITPMTECHHQVALPGKGHYLQGLSSMHMHNYRREHHFSLQTVLYLKEIRKVTGHAEAVEGAMNNDQLMEITTAFHHEGLHCLGKMHEETLLFMTSMVAAPNPDRWKGFT